MLERQYNGRELLYNIDYSYSQVHIKMHGGERYTDITDLDGELSNHLSIQQHNIYINLLVNTIHRRYWGCYKREDSMNILSPNLTS